MIKSNIQVLIGNIQAFRYLVYLIICYYSVQAICLNVQDLKADPNDELLKILRATIKSLTNPANYFEKVLRLAIDRKGTDETALTRVVATRAEFDMKAIKEEYKKRSSVSLDEAIAKDTRGDYEDMLIALIGSIET